MRTVAATLVLQIALTVGVSAQEGRPARPPIIDMHVHALELWAAPGEDAGVTFGPAFGERRLGLPAARSTEHLQELTLAALDRYIVVFAVVTGERSTHYRALGVEQGVPARRVTLSWATFSESAPGTARRDPQSQSHTSDEHALETKPSANGGVGNQSG